MAGVKPDTRRVLALERVLTLKGLNCQRTNPLARTYTTTECGLQEDFKPSIITFARSGFRCINISNKDHSDRRGSSALASTTSRGIRRIFEGWLFISWMLMRRCSPVLLLAVIPRLKTLCHRDKNRRRSLSLFPSYRPRSSSLRLRLTHTRHSFPDY